MTDCVHLARTSAYFDGALDAADEQATLAHVATCTQCQQLLGDAGAIDAVLSTSPPVAASAPGQRRRWPLAAAVAGAVAIAAVAIYLVRPHGGDATQVAIALPRERALEARFTGAQFAVHRPFGVLRGEYPTEAIPLAALAELEQRGDTHDLIAALASTGDGPRAGALAARLPLDARAESDRAAVALATGDPERALGHAYHALRLDPALASAWWNLALAARARGLARVSRAAFQQIVQRHEPGWSDEAASKLRALDAELAPRDEFPAFDRRARAMVNGGPVIDVADVRRFPAFARVYVLDALRLASGTGVEPLRPLAHELDVQSGSSAMTAAADRAAAADPALRAGFAASYRAVVARTASPAQITQLADALRAAGPSMDDLRVGTIITGGQAQARLAELAAAVAPWHDPWFDLVIERERIHAAYPDGDLRAIPALAVALAPCHGDAWALRCGQLAQDLANRLFESGRQQDGEPWAVRAVDWFAHAVAPLHLETARASLGDHHRMLGRAALARAELEEVSFAVGDTSCPLQRFSAIARAELALLEQDWSSVRAVLPSPVAPAGCAPALVLQGISTAADLARQTADPLDQEVARAWIAAAQASNRPDQDGVALIATARLARGGDPAATAAVRDWLAKHPPTASQDRSAVRMWGFTTLVADAGAHEDWAGVLEVATFEHPAAARAACLVVASFDDGALTVAVGTPSGALGDHRRIDVSALATTTIVPRELTQALAGCPAIAVDARPPLHGRADVLPATLPWWFAGDAVSAAAAGTGPAIEIASPRPPDTSLPPLPEPTASTVPFDRTLRGSDATPTRVLAALGDASYAELHVHGVAAVHDEDAAFLALSPDPDGTFTLNAERVRHAKLRGAPLVVLAACRAATVAADQRERWSLPDAFLAAGASAVVAVDVAIPDATAQRVFDALHRRVAAGEPVETVIASLRVSATGDTAWATHLMLFR